VCLDKKHWNATKTTISRVCAFLQTSYTDIIENVDVGSYRLVDLNPKFKINDYNS